MRTAIFALVAITLAAINGTVLFAQAPARLTLPGAVGHLANDAGPAATAIDITVRYGSRREAAIAALKAGNDAATVARAPQRALGLFLLSARRDPLFATAVYDLGVMCAREERWDDALNFYREAATIDSSAEMTRLTQAEIARVQLIASLEKTPDGQRARQFDIRFLSLVAKQTNTVASLEEATQLAKTDPDRWEAPALIGLLQALSGKYAESAKALDSAARMAPAERRKSLASAAELARSESSYEELVRAGNENWDRQQYDAAAKAYASAWETSPSRDQIGMRAATAFLMADEIPLAARTLAKLRDSGGPETSAKAGLMLKELGAVSDEAKQLALADSGSSRPEPLPDLAERIRSALGDLTSSEMQLAAKENPPLLRDDTRFIPVPDDELTSNASEAVLRSTQSVFQLYRKTNPADSPQPNAPVDVPAPAVPAADAPVPAPDTVPGHPQKFDTRPVAPAEPGRASAPSSPAGSTTVASVPEGATVTLDDSAAPGCTTPCQIELAPGRHTLQARLAGYRDLQKIFEVPASRVASVALPFSAKRGTVSIQTAIPGAVIVVDGQQTGRLTPADLSIDEGQHKIEVVAGSKTDVANVTVRDNDLMRLSF